VTGRTFVKVVIISAVIVFFIMQNSAYSHCGENNKKQKEEKNVIFSIEEFESQENNGFLLKEDKNEDGSQEKIEIKFEEINKKSEEKYYYKLYVNLNKDYIDSQNWNVEVFRKGENFPSKYKITEEQIDCLRINSESGLISKTIKRKINGRVYCVESRNEGAAGSIYSEYSYATIKNGNLVIVNCVIRYSQCMNYSEPDRTYCLKEQESFDLDKIIDYMVDSLIVNFSLPVPNTMGLIIEP